jgi:hypothetical protein
MLCAPNNSNNVAADTIDGPVKNDRKHFTSARNLLGWFLTCLMLAFGCLFFTQSNQLSVFKSSVRGLIDILASDNPLPPKPMMPTPPLFAYSKGHTGGASSARVFRMKEIDPNQPVYGVGPGVTNPETTLAAAPDLTGTGIVGAVPGTGDIADVSFIIQGIATAEKHTPALHNSATLGSLNPLTR